MLYLHKPSLADLDKYYETLKDNILGARDTSGIPQDAIDYLSDVKIKAILTDEPGSLLAHHDTFMPFLIPGFNIDEYQDYFSIKLIPDDQRNDDERSLIVKYDGSIKATLKIFNYEKFLTRSKKRSYDLALKLKRHTCTYCNRLYTNTVVYKDPETNRVNDTTRITRPQFDHWYAHSRFPLLGLSFYNLIPSCSVCNSSVKGDEPFDLETHVHPYRFESDQHFTFSFFLKDIDEHAVKIIATGDKMKKHLNEFKIQQVYNAHSNLELKDLLDLKYKYSENYLNTLFEESFKTLQIDKKEVYRLIFGVEYTEMDFHKRTFSKFKNDILNELGIIA